MNSPSCV
jgi:type II secretory ATPase GspE/PulE/Tfp pilus assembly ATPase PilB-like protein